MRISITRSGGFAGLSESIADVDTSSSSGGAARQVEQKLESVGFFDLPADVPDRKPGADLYRYEIAAVDGERRHTVAFNDSGGPQQSSLLELVDLVTAAAKDAKR